MKYKNFVNVFRSKGFKTATLILGGIFMVVSSLSVFDPQPFLKFGYLGIFLFNLFGGGSLLVFTLAQYMNIYLLAAVSAIGMAGNDSVAWIIGHNGEDLIPRSNKTIHIEKTVQKYGVYTLFVWSLIPMVYDIVGLIAGYLGMSYKNYIIPTFLGKFIRFVMIGILMT